MSPAPPILEPRSGSRLAGVDWLRGLAMALMLIDHTRDFLHAESFWHRATDLSVISSATFLTRWITHFCAPVFLFLAGLSVHLMLQGGRDPRAVRRFLWTRGLWLVFCEFTLVTLGAEFQWEPWRHTLLAQVIWVLGVSMILMALLVRLPWGWILGLGLALVFGHNLLDPIQAGAGPWAAVWTVLHQVGPVTPFGTPFPRIYFLYPVIPWPGVMALGFALGRCYQLEPARRRRLLARLGGAGILLFVLIRAWGGYGDPAPWSAQTNGFRTLLSFVNTTKYPPSLLYLLMTLSPALLLLAWREGRAANPLDRALSTLGRVPMFFYLLQWPVAHGMGVLFHALAGKPWRAVLHLHRPFPAELGFRLWAVYLAWALGLALLFPLCKAYAGLKQRHRDGWWWSYL
jgi:uncharacterized membrane protein